MEIPIVKVVFMSCSICDDLYFSVLHPPVKIEGTSNQYMIHTLTFY